MIKIFSIIGTLILGASAVSAQNYSNDVTLISDDGNTITLEVTASADKKKDAEVLATKSAFNTLFHNGIDGLKGGKPIFASEKKDYDYRFFTEARYFNFISGEAKTINTKKYNNKQHATVRLTIGLKQLLNDLERNKVVINPNWQNQKEVAATAALNPTIVVVPYAPNGADDFESMRKIIDSSDFTKQLVNAVSAEFSKHGYKTRDFVAMLQNSKTSGLLQDGTQSDLATKVVQQLPGDIVVTVDGSVSINAKGQGECAVGIRAVERQTAGNLAAASFNSGLFNTSDSLALSGYALKKITSSFFSDLSNAFDKIVQDGREVVLELTLSSSIDDWDFEQDSPVSGSHFMTTFDEWLRANAHHGVYDMSNNTEKYIHATLNVPLWDMQNDRSYTLSNFSRDLKKFFKSQLGDDYSAKVTSMGQRLNVVIE